MDYREKWLNTLRELGQFDSKAISKLITKSDGMLSPGAKFFAPINEHFGILFRRGKEPVIEILRKNLDSSSYTHIYCSYYSQETLDKLSTDIKEKVTEKLEELKNKARYIKTKFSSERTVSTNIADTDVIKELIKVLYEIVNDAVEKYVSETARVKYGKDIRPRLYSRLKKSVAIKLDSMGLYRMAYDILKNTDVLKEEQEKREFTTTKTKWNIFYKNLNQDTIDSIILKLYSPVT